MNNLIKFAESFFGSRPEIKPIKGAGSNRKYFRLLVNECSYIGVIGQDVLENEAFFYLANHLKVCGLRVPEVLAISPDKLMYIQNDLGEICLFDMLMDANSEAEKVMSQLVEDLAKFQIDGAKEVDTHKFYGIERMDRRSIMWDLNYFKYNFLKCVGVNIDEEALECCFENMAAYLCSLDGDYLLYRDFQSRNIMVKDGQPYYIDFQGARLGPLGYDIVSFLYQAKANFSPEVRQKYLDLYLQAVGKYGLDTKQVSGSISTFILFRTLQVLGAYGFRGFFEKKAHFLQSIAPALRNLGEVATHDFSFDCSYLIKLCKELAKMAAKFEFETPSDKLTVTITSFSFFKGIPNDYSGNGGGFVFDCRSIYNPGREVALRSLTGMDLPVIEHLDANDEMQTFIARMEDMVDSAVEKYISRSFNHLMVNFGCTGGQHRSVYSAERCAKHIKAKYKDVRVVLIHREQNVRKIFE